MSSSVAPPSSRRSFLDVVLGLSATTWIVSALYPVLRYLKPLPATGPTGPTRLSAAQQAKLQKDQFVIVPATGKRVIVFQDDKANIRALDARCTHEGCTVQFLPQESTVWCACHNARFDMDGRVLSGPPPRPLPQYTTQQTDDGAIVVILEKV